MFTRRREDTPGRLIRQGDVLLVPIEEVPAKAKMIEGGPGTRLVLLEGEATGHAHTVSQEGAVLISDDEAEQLYLQVYGFGGTILEHDEHAPLHVPAGTYEVRRQREWAPERTSTWVLD